MKFSGKKCGENHFCYDLQCRNLTGNNLTGSLPVELIERSNNHSLSLRYYIILFFILSFEKIIAHTAGIKLIIKAS